MIRIGIVLLAAALVSPASAQDRHGRRDLPGRPVKVAAIAIGFGGEHDKKLKLALEHLRRAGENGVDIACLPEEFAGIKAEPVPGPTTDAVARLAKKYGMYVICPIREQAERTQYNTAVLIDRAGKVVGRYRKVFPYWDEQGVSPSTEGVKVFLTDFGRIAILTCFDINFPELWQEAERLDAEIVFWPSAYAGGRPLNAYAMLHHYYVVPVGKGNFIDITGETIKNIQDTHTGSRYAVLDLDRTLVHVNFNTQKVARLLKEHANEVELEQFANDEAWYLLRAVKPGARVRDLCREYQIETLRQYIHRTRKQINQIRRFGGTMGNPSTGIHSP